VLYLLIVLALLALLVYPAVSLPVVVTAGVVATVAPCRPCGTIVKWRPGPPGILRAGVGPKTRIGTDVPRVPDARAVGL